MMRVFGEGVTILPKIMMHIGSGGDDDDDNDSDCALSEEECTSSSD